MRVVVGLLCAAVVGAGALLLSGATDRMLDRGGDFTLARRVMAVPPGEGGGVSGTGFFIAYDGRLLTAAHVVRGCRRVNVISDLVPPVEAEVLAADADRDVALVQVRGLIPPAILPYGAPSPSASTLYVLGYPGGGDLRHAAETWAPMVNDQLRPATHQIADARAAVWLQSRPITHGWSGGPVLDTISGRVVGIMRAVAYTDTIQAMVGVRLDDLALATGSSVMRGFIRQSLTLEPAMTAIPTGQQAVETARRATVHVFCWR